MLAEFRCTRNRPYVLCNCPGRKDVRARQGYYIRAKDSQAALERMAEHFPGDMQFGFTCDLWKLPEGMSFEHYNQMLEIMS